MKSNSLIKDVDLFLDDKPYVYALRGKARFCVEKNGFPNKKNEAFKYTDISEIVERNFNILENTEHCGGQCSCGEENFDDEDCFIRIKFCKGRIRLEDYNVPRGVRVVGLPEALYEEDYKKYIFKSFDLDKHSFAALNGVYLEQGIVIEVEKGVSCSKPLVICYHSDNCDNKMFNIHNIVVLEKEAKLDIVEKFDGSEKDSYFMNIVNEFYLKNGSDCKHYKVQKEGVNAYHIALNAVKVDGNGIYKQYYFAKGAKISRNETLLELQDEGANAEVYSMYVAKSGTLTDITTNVNHNVVSTYSNQYAKAVLEEGSKACFQGKVRIEKDAIKSVGNQLHKALYLGDNAELNCKPELEIYADDVKCSHGASCGEMDGEQLFYLTSRGISLDDAKKMLIDAHLEEILQMIENDKIRDLFLD